MSSAHRPGPLKQQNKSHKTGKHRSRGAVDTATKGTDHRKSCTILFQHVRVVGLSKIPICSVNVIFHKKAILVIWAFSSPVICFVIIL